MDVTKVSLLEKYGNRWSSYFLLHYIDVLVISSHYGQNESQTMAAKIFSDRGIVQVNLSFTEFYILLTIIIK